MATIHSLSQSPILTTPLTSPTRELQDQALRSKIESLITPSVQRELEMGKIAGVSIEIAGEKVWIPRQFLHGEVLSECGCLFDVDGVVREGTDGKGSIADQRVITNIQRLLRTNGVFVSFISGSPAANDRSVEEWRRGNVPLTEVFGSSFADDIRAGNVTIFGGFGGQCVGADGKGEALDEYSLECSFELCRALLRAFLKIVLQNGEAEKQTVAKELLAELSTVKQGEGSHQTNVTADEFAPVVQRILRDIDPGFRIINNGPSVAMKCPNALRNVKISSEMIKQEMNQSSSLASLQDTQKQVSSGIEKKNGLEFTYVVVSKTDKEATAQKVISAIQSRFPSGLIVSFGDGAADYQMHKHAALAFHVGSLDIYAKNPLAQCVMVRDQDGKGSQFVVGTAKVLENLVEGWGKSFYDIKYIQKQSADGKWQSLSLRDLLLPLAQ